MILTGTTTSPTYWKARIVVTEVSQDIANNTTTLNISFQLGRDIVNSYVYAYYTNWFINVDSNESGTQPLDNFFWDPAVAGAWKEIASRTVVVTHNTDGTKSVNISARWFNTGVSPSEASVTGTVTLTTILRATTPTTPITCKIGEESHISIPYTQAQIFSHRFSYKFGALSGEIGTASVGQDTFYWVPPLSLAEQIPNSSTGIGTIICDTYNGNTLIGSKSVEATFYLLLDSTPKISSVEILDATSGLQAQFGGYVQGKSRVQVKTVAQGMYGSYIKKISVKIESITYSGDSIVSNVLKTYGQKPILIEITDSRGFTTSEIYYITVYQYSAPTGYISGVRANALGEDDPKGEYLKYSYSYNVSPVNEKNTSSIQIQYKQKMSSSWINLDTKTGYSGSFENVLTSNAILSTDNSYQLRMVVSDYFTSVSIEASEIPTGTTIMDIHSSGNGIAFGKVSEEENTFDVAWNAKFRGNVDFKNPQQARENIGAAPDGYGLGKNANTFSAEQKPTIADFTQTGWYRYAYDTSDNPYPGYGGIVQVIASDILLIQLAYPAALNYRKNSVSMRQRVDGSWQSWIELYSSGTVPVSSGGTGATTADEARKNLGVRIHENCSNTDFNTIKEPGTYYGYTGMTNAKFPNSISVLEVIQYSPDWVVQRQTAIGSKGNQTWERHWYMANTWTDWKQIYTSNEMAWKKASVTFSSGAGTMSASGVTTSSAIITTRGDSSISGGNYAAIGAADCKTAGTIQLATSNGASATWTVSAWWSK